jgi:serine/threonine protein kinase
MASERISRYEVGGRISAGGMAEIYAARAVAEPGIAKRVALKKILRGFCADPSFVGRFLDEARLAMRLSHANVVQVFDFGRTDEEQYFLAMEFVEGVDLKRFLLARPAGPLPLGDALYIAGQTLRGLHYAHRQTDDHGTPLGVVHRDVKPANVLVSFEGEVKLTDFGIARSRAGSQLSSAGDICGTIPFMSPEQAHGRPVDARSDVFSVGTMLYAMATGVHPFEAESDFATLDRVRAAACAPPSQHGTPAEFDALLMRALQLRPEDRYDTAGVFADAIDEYLYEHGLRGGAAALGRHLQESFPEERERLNALFTVGAGSEALAVARPGSTGGFTQLSHVDAVKSPERHTQAALTMPGSSRRTLVALAVAGALFLAAGVVFAVVWSRPAPLPAPQAGLMADLSKGIVAGRPPGVAVGHAVAGAATQPAATRPAAATGPAATGPTAGRPLPPEKRPRPPLPAAPTGPGTLTVNANPWGNVYVNGKLIKATPLLRHPMRAGPVTVMVENPKLGRKTTTVRIKPGQDTPVIIDLRNGNK